MADYKENCERHTKKRARSLPFRDSVSWGVSHTHKPNPDWIVIIATMEKKNHTSISARGKERLILKGGVYLDHGLRNRGK